MVVKVGVGAMDFDSNWNLFFDETSKVDLESAKGFITFDLEILEVIVVVNFVAIHAFNSWFYLINRIVDLFSESGHHAH
jgi:hypothetical protein